MDARASANPVLASARRWLARVNARHPWSHNEHFHGWILRNLPARRRAAVDVGCGTGVLAGKLARTSRALPRSTPMRAWQPPRARAWPMTGG